MPRAGMSRLRNVSAAWLHTPRTDKTEEHVLSTRQRRAHSQGGTWRLRSEAARLWGRCGPL